MKHAYFRPNKAGAALIAAGRRLSRVAPDHGTWWLRYKDEAGRLVRERTTARMADEAERLGQEKALLAERIRSGLASRPAAQMTCEELVQRYEESNQHQASLGPMRSQLRLWIAPHFGKQLVAQVTPSDCAALLAKSRKAGHAPATVRMLYIRARLVFEHARRHLRLIQENPMAALPRPGLPRRAVNVLEPAQIGALLAAARGFRLLLMVALFTGLRRGELGALKWDDIDFSRRVLHVRRSWARATTKSGKERLVPIHQDLLPELQSARRAVAEGESFVFPAPRKGGMRSTSWHVSTLLRNIARRAGVVLPEGFTFHGLRKQFGSYVHQATGDLVATQRLLGHASPQVTASVYLADDVQHLARQVSRIRLVAGATGGHMADTQHDTQGGTASPETREEQQMRTVTPTRGPAQARTPSSSSRRRRCPPRRRCGTRRRTA